MTAETRAAEVLAVINAHQYVPSLARGVSKCSCGLQLHGMPHHHREHLADEIAAGFLTTWDCDNFAEPATCLSAGVSETGRCGRCVLRLALARETVRLARDDREGGRAYSYAQSRALACYTRGDREREREWLDLLHLLDIEARDDREGETVTEWGYQDPRTPSGVQACGSKEFAGARGRVVTRQRTRFPDVATDWSPVTPDGGDPS